MKATQGSHAAAAALAAVALLSGACGGGAAPPPAAAAVVPSVEVVRIVQRIADGTVSMPGELEAFETVAVFPRATGFVRTVSVDRGSRVRAGQVLAVLDAPELVAQRAEAQSKVQAAEAQLAAAHARADASSATFDKLRAAAATPGVVAGNDLALAQKGADGDRSQVTAAEQAVEGARQGLRSATDLAGYLRLTAPFDGVVTERNVHPGALVGPNAGQGAATPLFRIVQDRRLRLVVPLPEAYAASADGVGVVPFTVQSYPNETFSGRVARIAHAIDVKTRTMAVEVDVTNADGRLSPGEFCQVRWPIRRSGPSMLVPPGAIASTTDRTFVVRIRDGRAEWVDVKVGLASNGLVEIFGSVHPDDQIASRGTDELRPGTQVRPTEQKPSPKSGP